MNTFHINSDETYRQWPWPEPNMKATNQTPAAPAQAQHSPLPWSIDDREVIVDLQGYRVLANGDKFKTNQAFIVRACNAYPHAQRLADVIKHTLPIIGKMAVIEGGYIKCKLKPHDAESFHLVYSEMREALAEWSKK